MATTVRDPDQAARPRARWAVPAYRWLLLAFLLDGLGDDSAAFGGLHALDGLLIAVSAGVQYILVRLR